jgi:hypothetical protein
VRDLARDFVVVVDFDTFAPFSRRYVAFGSSLGLGCGNATAGRSASAAVMNRDQIDAGYDPPVTRIPPTFVIGTSPTGAPIHTAVASWGVYPTSHASW